MPQPISISRAASVEAFTQQGLHEGDLLVARAFADGGITHDRAAQRAMPDQESRIHRDPPFEPLQIIAEALPVPRQRAPQRLPMTFPSI